MRCGVVERHLEMAQPTIKNNNSYLLDEINRILKAKLINLKLCFEVLHSTAADLIRYFGR